MGHLRLITNNPTQGGKDGTVYQATSGAVGYMEIKGSTDGETWSTDNIEIDARSLATFDAANIAVTINS